MTDRSIETSDRIASIEERLAKLEAPKEEERFLWIFKNWQEMLKVVALPLTLLYGGLQFYDEVWTRGEKQQAAAAAAGQESLRELQAMNAEIYRMQADGEGDRVDAYREANRGRISRLVAEATVLWQAQPEYFLPNEKQVLANELLLEGRNDVALEIGQDLASGAEGPIEQANTELFMGRITGSEGPAQDLEAMREHMERALAHAEELDPPGRSYASMLQILIAWIFYELYEGADCDQMEAIASRLADVTMPPNEPAATLADRMATERLQLYAERCLPN
jgi:hypothetical protein